MHRVLQSQRRAVTGGRRGIAMRQLACMHSAKADLERNSS